MGEEKIKFSEYQIKLMKKIIIQKIQNMEYGDELFNVMLVIEGVRESLVKHIEELENKKKYQFSRPRGLKINQSIL